MLRGFFSNAGHWFRMMFGPPPSMEQEEESMRQAKVYAENVAVASEDMKKILETVPAPNPTQLLEAKHQATVARESAEHATEELRHALRHIASSDDPIELLVRALRSVRTDRR